MISSQACVPAEVLQSSQISYHVCVGSRESSDDEWGQIWSRAGE